LISRYIDNADTVFDEMKEFQLGAYAPTTQYAQQQGAVAPSALYAQQQQGAYGPGAQYAQQLGAYGPRAQYAQQLGADAPRAQYAVPYGKPVHPASVVPAGPSKEFKARQERQTVMAKALCPIIMFLVAAGLIAVGFGLFLVPGQDKLEKVSPEPHPDETRLTLLLRRRRR